MTKSQDRGSTVVGRVQKDEKTKDVCHCIGNNEVEEKIEIYSSLFFTAKL